MKRFELWISFLGVATLCGSPMYAQEPTPPRSTACSITTTGKPHSGTPSLSDLWETYKTHKNSVATTQCKIDKADGRLVNKLLTDRFELTVKPQFGNTIPNILGNPTISTDQFTLKPDVLQLGYKLPFKEVFKGRNGGVYRYFLDFWEFGVSGGLGPKADKFAVGQPVVTLLNVLQGTALIYVQFKVPSKDLRKAKERGWDAELKKKQDERDRARDDFLEALLHRVEALKSPSK